MSPQLRPQNITIEQWSEIAFQYEQLNSLQIDQKGSQKIDLNKGE